MATPSAQLDHPAVRERVLEILRSLLNDLGSEGALPMLGPSSRLDHELGLGSLERVELLARLEAEFGVRLPDQVAAEINTPEALAVAVLAAPGNKRTLDEAPSALRASMSTEMLDRSASDQQVFAAQTLIDILRYRAQHDAERPHLHISEDSDTGEKNLALTFGDVFCFLRGHTSRRGHSRPNLSAVPRRPHRRIRRAPSSNFEQRGSVPAADISSRRSRREVIEAARSLTRICRRR